MEKQLIRRGVLAGVFGGLVTFVFARVFAGPVIQQAIDYESAREAAQDKLDRAAGIAVPPAGTDVFSRTVQADLGAGAGLILFGAAMGALVAVAFVICIGRTGGLRPRPLALLVPAFLFVGIYLVPFAKYPANPPGVGHEDTIRDRGSLYLLLVVCSCLGLFLAVYLGQKLRARAALSTWTVSILMGLGYVAAMAILFAVLPPFGQLHANVAEYGRHATETPLPLTDPQGNIVFPGFPADVLAQFRACSVAAQVILWGVLALTFAPWAERVLDPGAAERRRKQRAGSTARPTVRA